MSQLYIGHNFPENTLTHSPTHGWKTTMTEYTYKMAYKFDAVEEGELTCRKDQLVTSDSKFDNTLLLRSCPGVYIAPECIFPPTPFLNSLSLVSSLTPRAFFCLCPFCEDRESPRKSGMGTQRQSSTFNLLTCDTKSHPNHKQTFPPQQPSLLPVRTFLNSAIM